MGMGGSSWISRSQHLASTVVLINLRSRCHGGFGQRLVEGNRCQKLWKKVLQGVRQVLREPSVRMLWVLHLGIGMLTLSGESPTFDGVKT